MKPIDSGRDWEIPSEVFVVLDDPLWEKDDDDEEAVGDGVAMRVAEPLTGNAVAAAARTAVALPVSVETLTND